MRSGRQPTPPVIALRAGERKPGGAGLDVLIGWPGGDWQATVRLVATVVGGYLFVLWATSVLWVYRDIRSRTRDPISQLTAVVITVAFPLVSLPVYVALRPTETLQDSYLRLLEREVLLSELGAMQEGTVSRPQAAPSAGVGPRAQAAPSAGAGSRAQAASSAGAAPRAQATPSAAAESRGSAGSVGPRVEPRQAGAPSPAGDRPAGDRPAGPAPAPPPQAATSASPASAGRPVTAAEERSNQPPT